MIGATVATAVAIVLAVPAAFAAILRLSEGPASRWRLNSLALALRALRATSPLAIGLVATGAVAVFGAVGLHETHASLLDGMDADFRGNLGTADVWVAQPGDDLALEPFDARGVARRVAAVAGVRDVRPYYGGLLDLGVRRTWVTARSRADPAVVPPSQVVDGDVHELERRVRAGGWVTVSQQVAADEGVAVGGRIRLPTPAGEVAYRVAATTTNLGWGPGAVVMSARDHRRAWGDDDPAALEVDVAPGADVAAVARSIRHALGERDGALWVQTAPERVARLSETARAGLAWGGRGAVLLLIAAGLAMSAAIGAGTWQRRVAFGHLRLMGWRPVKTVVHAAVGGGARARHRLHGRGGGGRLRSLRGRSLAEACDRLSRVVLRGCRSDGHDLPARLRRDADRHSGARRADVEDAVAGRSRPRPLSRRLKASPGTCSTASRG